VPRQKVRSGGTKMAPPAKEDGKWVCPIDGCREAAIHPQDDCSEFGGLTVTKRQKVLKERDLCECCLTDCKDEETGTRCYQQTGFRQHRVLRLAVQQEAIQTDRVEQKRDQSRNSTMGKDRQLKDAPPEKIRRLNSIEQNCSKGRKVHPLKQMVTWCFPAFGIGGDLVCLRAIKNRYVPVTRITHQAAMR
jgi:hypothetical protein